MLYNLDSNMLLVSITYRAESNLVHFSIMFYSSKCKIPKQLSISGHYIRNKKIDIYITIFHDLYQYYNEITILIRIVNLKKYYV